MSEVIYAYSRKNAIEDGMLHDLNQPARIMGYKIPVAITCAALSASYTEKGDNFEVAKAADNILRTLLRSIAQQQEPADRVSFAVRLKDSIIQMYAVVGPGDTKAPVITIMLKGED